MHDINDSEKGDATRETTPAERPAIVESASGTTSPDNADSGPFAYVAFGIGVALLALLVLSFTSCVGSVAKIAAVGAERNDVRVRDLLPDGGVRFDYDPDGIDGLDVEDWVGLPDDDWLGALDGGHPYLT